MQVFKYLSSYLFSLIVLTGVCVSDQSARVCYHSRSPWLSCLDSSCKSHVISASRVLGQHEQSQMA